MGDKDELKIIVKRDGEGWLATCEHLPWVYGFGRDFVDAAEAFNRNLRSLWKDIVDERNNLGPLMHKTMTAIRDLTGWVLPEA